MSEHPRPYPGQELSVGEVAERSGVPVSALHFYEREGLIPAAARPATSAASAARCCAGCRSSASRSASASRWPRSGPRSTPCPTGAPRPAPTGSELSAQWREELDHRIRRLEQLRDDFTGCIGCGCLSIDRCGLVNPHDRLGEDGPGPRRLVG